MQPRSAPHDSRLRKKRPPLSSHSTRTRHDAVERLETRHDDFRNRATCGGTRCAGSERRPGASDRDAIVVGGAQALPITTRGFRGAPGSFPSRRDRLWKHLGAYNHERIVPRGTWALPETPRGFDPSTWALPNAIRSFRGGTWALPNAIRSFEAGTWALPNAISIVRSRHLGASGNARSVFRGA
jgi:hypothetical protein